MAVFFSLAFAPCQGEIAILTVENQNVNSSGTVGVSYTNVLSLAYTTSDNGCSFSGATYNGVAVSTVTTGDSHVSTLDESEVKIGCPDGDLLTVSCVGSGGASQDGEDTVRIIVSNAPTGSCPECGNGDVDTGEVCDDGGQCSNGVACTQDSQCAGIGDAQCRTRSCDGCSSNCAVSEPLTCGDNIVCPPEQCDGGYCNPNCTFYRCGDGIINFSEEAVFGLEYCDDGDATHCGTCNGTCTGPGIGVDVCGDGVVCGESWGETCDEDDGGDVCWGNCNATCDGPANACGDGIVRCGEECDDGNAVGADGCGATCQDEPVAISYSLGLPTTDPSKTVALESGIYFTNDRSLDLFSAAVTMMPGSFTNLELLVTVATPDLPGGIPCLPVQNLTIPLTASATPNLWTALETRTDRTLPLCGGVNQIVLRVRDENGAISGGVSRSVDSAWVEFHSPANSTVTTDDWMAKGCMNRPDLEMQIRLDGFGPTPQLLSPLAVPHGYVPVCGHPEDLFPFCCGAGEYYFLEPVNARGHNTRIGFRRPGHPDFELVEQTYTLDPLVYLIPVYAWIVLAATDTVGSSTNIGSNATVEEIRELFDNRPETDAESPTNIDSIYDGSSVDVQFDLQSVSVIRVADDLAENPFAWVEDENDPSSPLFNPDFLDFNANDGGVDIATLGGATQCCRINSTLNAYFAKNLYATGVVLGPAAGVANRLANKDGTVAFQPAIAIADPASARIRAVVAHEVGHYLSLSHLCLHTGNPGKPCCEPSTNFECSYGTNQSDLCVPGTTGVDSEANCVAGGGICFQTDRDCTDNFPLMECTLSQRVMGSCEDGPDYLIVDDKYFEIRRIHQTLQNSINGPEGNWVVNLNE